MAKKFEELKREFASLEQNTLTVAKEFRMMMTTESNLEGILEHGAKEIGILIQHMRDAGHPGRLFTDFYRDVGANLIPNFKRQAGELKEMLLALESEVQRLEKNIPTLTQLATQGAALIRAWTALEKDLADKVAQKSGPARAAAAAAAGLGVDKYLQKIKELEKMQESIKKSKQSGGGIKFLDDDVVGYDNRAGHFKTLRDTLVTRAFKNTKGEVLSEAQEDMYLQLLNERLLHSRHQHAGLLHKTIVGYCQTQEEIIKRSKPDKPLVIAPPISKALADIRGLGEQFEKAMQDNAVKHKIRQSPSGQKILDSFQFIVRSRDDAVSRVQALLDLDCTSRQRLSGSGTAAAAARSK
jgi:hypothetical protein